MSKVIKKGPILQIKYDNGETGYKTVDDYDDSSIREILYYDDGSLKEVMHIPKKDADHGGLITRFTKGAEKGLMHTVIKDPEILKLLNKN